MLRVTLTWQNLHTRVYYFFSSAYFAFNLTAPMKRTVAPFGDDFFVRAVTPAAAHDVTSINAYRSGVALSSVRPLDTQLGVALAKPWTHLVVNQILESRWLVFRIERFQLEPVLVLSAVLPFAVDAVSGDAVEFRTGQPVVRFVVSLMTGGGNV